MELRHLRYFVAIGEEENYRRAAERLHVAQTALSTQIQDLEAELGFKLFDRLPRGVKLSVAGRLFLEDAGRILREVNEAATRAARVARGQSGTLRLALRKARLGMALSRIRSGDSGTPARRRAAAHPGDEPRAV
jgi:DNA-binding transcriptional LysR family regulator